MTPFIELRNLHLKFTAGRIDQEVFRQLNLKVFSGDSVVVVGPSGQGKSVLLKLMGNLILPSSGDLYWGGQSVKDFSEEERQHWCRQIGMLFQKNALFDSMTVFENVAFPLIETTKLDAEQIRFRVEEYLKAVDLFAHRDLFPSQMSGGMQKRLGIARALALEPKIVLYDDPTAGLDPITSRRIIQLIQSLKEKFSGTIVTVTNDMNRAFQLAGRIIFVADQQILETGDKEQTLSHPNQRVRQFVRGEVEGPLLST